MVLFAFGFNGFGQIKTEDNEKRFISEPTPLELPYQCISRESSSSSNSNTNNLKELKIAWNYILAVTYNSDVFMWKSRNDCKSNCGILEEKFDVTGMNWNSVWAFNNTTKKLKMSDSSLDCFKIIMLDESNTFDKDGDDFQISGIHITDDEKPLLLLSGKNFAYKSLASAKDVYNTEFVDIELLKLFPERPMPVVIKQVSCGKHHVLLLTRIGTVLSYGNGNQGQLGLGSVESRNDPGVVEALEGLQVTQVSAGGWHSLALTDSGDIYVWGWNNFGQLGLPCDKSEQCDKEEDAEKNSRKVINIQMVPTCLNITAEEVETATDSLYLSNICFTEIASGSRHSLCLSANNEVFSWGWNKYGQLGYDGTEIQDHPKRIDFFKDKTVTKLYAGAWNSVVEADY